MFVLRAMVINKGMSVCSAGQGQLSAAYDGLTDIVGALMPAIWGYLFSQFANAASASTSGMLAWIGIGGHWMLAGCFRILAGLIVRSLARPEAAEAAEAAEQSKDVPLGATSD